MSVEDLKRLHLCLSLHENLRTSTKCTYKGRVFDTRRSRVSSNPIWFPNSPFSPTFCSPPQLWLLLPPASALVLLAVTRTGLVLPELRMMFVLFRQPGTFTTVTGTFTVPTPSGYSGSIDGDTCENAILQAGIDFTVDSNGEASYDRERLGVPSEFTFTICATVTAYSTTSGAAAIENLTNGQTVTQDITSDYALCEQNAEWIVEDF
ncbi:concanavalin A-like lectin/glucanase domain-containing protein [Chiua virens]|nr:concanavalin A-like lectin/glucanase domain-containing protein [Chiua virens]